MRKIGENKAVVNPAAATWTDLITAAQNTGGVVIRTISWRRSALDNSVGDGGVVSAQIGGADYGFLAFGARNWGAMPDDIAIPPGAAVRFRAAAASIIVAITWDDL